MSKTFVVLSVAGLHRDHTKGTREQPLWDERPANYRAMVAMTTHHHLPRVVIRQIRP